MVTKRIPVGIDDETLAVLRELSSVSNMSISAFVGDLLRQSRPQLLAMTEAFRLAKTNPARAMHLFGNIVDDTSTQISKMSNEIKDKRKPKATKKAG